MGLSCGIVGFMTSEVALRDELYEYARAVSVRDDDILRELREETAGLPGGRTMPVAVEGGQFLALLVKLVAARSVLEIGTFTGYSTLCMARALAPGGSILTCDITDKWPSIGAGYWLRAGVANRIEVRVGDALATLDDVLAERGENSVDLAFIDADKVNYPAYYAKVFHLVRPGGLIVIDNTLFFGRVIDPSAQDSDTIGIRELNALIRDDERVDVSLLPFSDGVTVVRKKD